MARNKRPVILVLLVLLVGAGLFLAGRQTAPKPDKKAITVETLAQAFCEARRAESITQTTEPALAVQRVAFGVYNTDSPPSRQSGAAFEAKFQALLAGHCSGIRLFPAVGPSQRG